MSRVSNFCIIGPSAYEGDYLQQLNNALFDLGTNDQFFSHLTGEGGAKHYEWFIYGMAGDFMDETMVMAAMQAVPWENRLASFSYIKSRMTRHLTSWSGGKAWKTNLWSVRPRLRP
ncbi:hypothetical protein CC53_gp136 [Rhizobium phage vB_RleS_L338C]|uniref:hypothetical protein n=1 Tax=Rhizobium phage vB_RleS_L338C TaxID=1414737 RepID=UPI0003D86EAC|nr:hypothetical protein CC53_gp136 [Rhizobium phage vB_RleS_L338C]AHC30553.1 hypothetical protein L338C_136 [Rhizobium phage vB_RleS_L338C]